MPDVSANTVPAKKPVNPITWGPLAAIIVTVTIYFAAQFFGALLILAAAKFNGFSSEQTKTWVDQVGPQFFFVVIVEATSLGALWLFLRSRKANFKTLGLVRPHWVDLGWTLIGFAMYLPILLIVMAAVKAWFPEVNFDQQQQIGFTGTHGAALLPVFVSLVVLPPVAEEIMTRGFLFLGLKNKLPVIWAAIVTSFIFATAHLQAGSGAPLLWTAAIDTFVLSMVLIFLRQKTGRLWSSIGLHMIKNGLAFAALFIFVR
jgi:membrane protease YdiL (CAAX protease family)